MVIFTYVKYKKNYKIKKNAKAMLIFRIRKNKSKIYV